jgi:hypothetical protein
MNTSNPFAYAQERKKTGAMFNTPYTTTSDATVPTAAASGEEYYQQDDFNFVADQPGQDETAAFIVP